MKDELINRNALKVKFAEMGILKSLPEKLIDEAPAIDAVEVIRCKDCIESENRNGRLFCGVFCCYMDGDDFCSGGKKQGESFQDWCRRNME